MAAHPKRDAREHDHHAHLARMAFPTADDLCNLSLDDANDALVALRVLAESDLVTVYTSAGSNGTRWQVWSNLQWRRFPLADWASRWCAYRDAYDAEQRGKECA